MKGIGNLTLGTGCDCGKPTCQKCAELANVARMIREDFEQTTRHVRVPTPEIVWWRAQMRAREEAARTAVRPILFTQALAIAALVGLLISVVGRLTLPALPAISWTAISPISAESPLGPIAVAVGCSLVFVPLALYFAFSSSRD